MWFEYDFEWSDLEVAIEAIQAENAKMDAEFRQSGECRCYTGKCPHFVAEGSRRNACAYANTVGDYGCPLSRDPSWNEAVARLVEQGKAKLR